jgi:hypothetical protein
LARSCSWVPVSRRTAAFLLGRTTRHRAAASYSGEV